MAVAKKGLEIPKSLSSPVGRPRDPEVDQAIIAATLEIIAEGGYEGLRVADVAKRAGVSKPTMYRRWPSKTDLVIAALQTTPPLDRVDTGSLRTDLLALLTQFLSIAESVPLAGLLAALAAERQRMPHLADVLDPFVADRNRVFIQVFQRAVARGEVDPDSDLSLAASLVAGPVLLRLFFGGATDPETVERFVEMAVRAIELR
jgi:AcrR family transcriptional regulator